MDCRKESQRIAENEVDECGGEEGGLYKSVKEWLLDCSTSLWFRSVLFFLFLNQPRGTVSFCILSFAAKYRELSQETVGFYALESSLRFSVDVEWTGGDE
ncbi:hypothetical protein VNO78_32880 [Psophocarpus tetragonolobus]|uniref:Uncharacterized protein n=1 Tax=Psophocarpus tetragonolobus TaxID=3891 RepID=A0AAN9NVY6_PSOTE